MKTLFLILLSFWIGWKHGDYVVYKVSQIATEMSQEAQQFEKAK